MKNNECFILKNPSWKTNKRNKSANLFQSLKEKNITLVAVRENLVDKIWTNRPAEETKQVAVQEFNYTGFYLDILFVR